MVDSSLSHAAGYFEGHLGILPAIFCGNKTRYFSWIVWPSPSVIVATKTGILSQTMMFSKPWPSVFVPEPNQSVNVMTRVKTIQCLMASTSTCVRKPSFCMNIDPCVQHFNHCGSVHEHPSPIAGRFITWSLKCGSRLNIEMKWSELVYLISVLLMCGTFFAVSSCNVYVAVVIFLLSVCQLPRGNEINHDNPLLIQTCADLNLNKRLFLTPQTVLRNI